MNSPAPSRPEGFDLVVVALSARALAASARRAGLRTLAIDLFADADTREHAKLAVQAEPNRRGDGFDRGSLLATLRAHAPEGTPVVLGAGFEHAPRLMAAIDRRYALRGARPETVATLKDPLAFVRLLARLEIPHPEVAARGPVDDSVWLSKRAGASGGAHIRLSETPGRRRYLQRRIDGRSVSALFLADGAHAVMIGFSEQWTDPAPKTPFRYGGAVGPVALDPPLALRIGHGIEDVVAATGLRGLASADLIVRPDAFHLIEINPRPGATLDVFDHGDGAAALVARHLAACDGRLPDAIPLDGPAHAAAVVYAETAVTPGLLPRPVWTADWPACEETIEAGAPVCTILAAGSTPESARARLETRRAALLSSLRAAGTARPSPNTMVHA